MKTPGSAGVPPAYTSLQDFDTALKIVQTVVDHFHISLADLESHRRPWKLVWPRWCAIALVRKHTSLNIPRIAALFNRDYDTIENALFGLADQIRTSRPDALGFKILDAYVAGLLDASTKPSKKRVVFTFDERSLETPAYHFTADDCVAVPVFRNGMHTTIYIPKV